MSISLETRGQGSQVTLNLSSHSNVSVVVDKDPSVALETIRKDGLYDCATDCAIKPPAILCGDKMSAEDICDVIQAVESSFDDDDEVASLYLLDEEAIEKLSPSAWATISNWDVGYVFFTMHPEKLPRYILKSRSEIFFLDKRPEEIEMIEAFDSRGRCDYYADGDKDILNVLQSLAGQLRVD